MPVNLSIKSVPDRLADRLRLRAERNRRSLQRELLSILERAADEGEGLAPAPAASGSETQRGRTRKPLSVEEVAARSRALFPRGTASSAAFIRSLRNSR
jgi:plasmid stability protein